MSDELLTDEIREIARSMITCSHYDNLPDWKLDTYLREILAKAKPLIEKQRDKEWEESGNKWLEAICNAKKQERERMLHELEDYRQGDFIIIDNWSLDLMWQALKG